MSSIDKIERDGDQRHVGGDGPVSLDHSPNGQELDPRKEYSLKLLIYALLIKADLVEVKLSSKELSGLLKEEFENSSKYQRNVRWPTAQTIRIHLREVNSLVRGFLISH